MIKIQDIESRSQESEVRSQNIEIRIKEKKMFFSVFCFLFSAFCLLSSVFFVAISFGEDFTSLKKDILKGNGENLELNLGKMDKASFLNNEFDEFYRFLESLEDNKVFNKNPYVYYYKAQTRLRYMQFLEKEKMWKEFFDNKDSYLEDLNKNLSKAKKLNESLDVSLDLKLKFLEWQLNKEDPLSAPVILKGLVRLSGEYIKEQKPPELLKDIASCFAQGNEGVYAKEFYNLYVKSISEYEVDYTKLRTMAENILQDIVSKKEGESGFEGGIALAVTLYDSYMEKLLQSNQEKSSIVKTLLSIAEKFSYSGWKKGLDSSYCEDVYKKIESLYGIEAFDAESFYARAYNLEGLKDYQNCSKEYLELLKRFPGYANEDRIYFKLGVLNAYLLGNKEQAETYFLKVMDNFKQSPDYFNSIYHLGLLNQFNGYIDKAKELFAVIIDKAKEDNFQEDLIALAKDRMFEIEQKKDIEYNLRMFLEAALNKNTGETKDVNVSLWADNSKSYMKKELKFQALSYLSGTGCLQPVYSYLWSGQLGGIKELPNKSSFQTEYPQLGTKVIGVVLIGSNGVAGRSLEMVDVEEENK